MDRALTIAKTEFLALVKTKFFILSVLLVPVMIGASVGFQVLAQKRLDKEDRAIAVIDHTGVLFAPLVRAAEEHVKDGGSSDGTPGPRFVLRSVDLAGRSAEDVKLDLSGQVKSKVLFAYVEIPAAVLDPNAASDLSIDYYTETPSYDDLPKWLQRTLSLEITRQRFQRASVDPDLAAKLSRATQVSTLGLLARSADGTVRPARKANQLETLALPFGMMYILFVAVMMNAPHMMTAVVEEKMSRISEVLLASASPFQILAGKLIGITAVSVALSAVYLGGGAYVAISFGQWGLVQPVLLGWFLVFLICAVLMFGSVFLAIGASSSDLKDAQSMMQPAMFFLLIPIFLSTVIIRSPSSMVSVVSSMIPTATPFLMLMRLALTPPPPMWQVLLSLALTMGTTVLFIWTAGKIFRIGLLMQGKPPNLPELWKWIRA
jgi:ABC-2 type transport system permease protein